MMLDKFRNWRGTASLAKPQLTRTLAANQTTLSCFSYQEVVCAFAFSKLLNLLELVGASGFEKHQTAQEIARTRARAA